MFKLELQHNSLLDSSMNRTDHLFNKSNTFINNLNNMFSILLHHRSPNNQRTFNFHTSLDKVSSIHTNKCLILFNALSSGTATTALSSHLNLTFVSKE